MFFLRLKGGLGNQLFQVVYALDRASHDEVVWVDLSTYNDSFEDDYAGKNVEVDQIISDRRLRYFSLPLVLSKIFWKVVSKFEFLQIKCLDGYFYNASLYDKKSDYSDLLRFKFQNNYSKSDVLIHVRKGDYVNGVNSKVFYNCDVEYFSKAISLISTKVASPNFFVMTNDENWVLKNFDFIDYTFLPQTNSVDGFKEMCEFKNFIISNSSYSWWAAMFSGSRCVVAPRLWYLTQSNEDLYPSGWILID